MERKHTLVYGIKGKLISAVCMLLVAMIMVVSSTYAWFTLSTAPEVSGISTAIGSNGALEIRLNNTVDPEDENAQPGNLVDLSGVKYGLDDIVLYPSTLNLNGNAFGASFLKVPGYGANGKPNMDNSKDTETGILTADGFVEGEGFGVRAVGITSGLTARQQAYREARNAVTTAVQNATNGVKNSLRSRSQTLTSIVLKKVGGAAYTEQDLEALQGIVTDLEAVIVDLEDAYKAQIKALAASKLTDDLVAAKKTADPAFEATADDIYAAVKTGIGNTITLSGIKETGKFTADGIEFVLNEEAPALYTAIVKYFSAKERVAAARTAVDHETNDVDTKITQTVALLINTDYVTLNGLTVDEAKGDTQAVINAIMRDGGRLIVKMFDDGSGNNAGIYVDIAEHCGDYQVGVTLTDVSYGSFTLETANATMVADSSVTTPYLTQASNDVTAQGQPDGTGSGALPMTQFYGYILDLAFKTNAAGSNLLLQVDPIDRIYADGSSQNPETMGGGSYFSYKSDDEGLSIDNIKQLMRAIRIVFFDTDDSNTILGYARLAVEVATVAQDGTVTAKMYKCNADGSTENVVEAIKLLPQNTEVKVSTLVYLEGETTNNMGGVDNTMVSAVSPKSLVGKMNIQFSSDADLKPMEYADLKKPAEDTNSVDVEFEVQETEGSQAVKIDSAKTTATKNQAFSIPTTVTNGYTISKVEYSVGGAAKVELTADNGAYTIPEGMVTDDIVITITGTANP